MCRCNIYLWVLWAVWYILQYTWGMPGYVVANILSMWGSIVMFTRLCWFGNWPAICPWPLHFMLICFFFISLSAKVWFCFCQFNFLNCGLPQADKLTNYASSLVLLYEIIYCRFILCSENQLFYVVQVYDVSITIFQSKMVINHFRLDLMCLSCK